MKVIKEETSQLNFNTYKDSYDNAESFEEKQNILLNLSSLSGCKTALNNIFKYGENFTDSWVDAMNWEELVRDDNEFVILMGENSIANKFKNLDDFVKIYNMYSDGSIEKKFLEEPVFKNLLMNSDTYKFNEREFREVFKLYNIINSNFNNVDSKQLENILQDIFYEDGSNGEHINSLNTIKTRVNKYVKNFDASNNDDTATKTNIDLDDIDFEDQNIVKDIINKLIDSDVAKNMVNITHK